FDDFRASQDGDALIGASQSVIGFLGAHTLGHKVGPLGLCEVLEAARPSDLEADNFRQAAVLAKEVLRSGSGDMTAGQRGLKGGDARPFLDAFDQIGGGRIRERVDYLVEDVVRLDQVDDGCRLGRPKVLEAAQVGVLAASKQAVEMLG